MSSTGPPPPPIPTSPTPAPPPPPVVAPQRPRVNGWLVALAVTSAVLLAVGLTVFLLGRSSQSDAESDRDAKQEQLTSQRRATGATEQEAQLRRAQATDVANSADSVLGLASQIAQYDSQIVTANRDAVNTFSNPDPTQYNAAVDRADALINQQSALIDQLNVAIGTLNAKLDALDQSTATSS